MEHSVSESKVSAVLNEFGLTNRIPFIIIFTSQEVPHYMTQKVEKLENSIYLSSLYAQKITNM